MSRMFPLLGSLLGSTPGRRRGGGVQGSFDFTTMSSAQLQEAGWSWTRANAIWVPDSAGDYAEIASGVLAKSDLGVHCFGGFTNLWSNPVWSGGTTGSPGTQPTYNNINNSPTINSTAASTYKGLPRWDVTYTNASAGVNTYGIYFQNIPTTKGEPTHVSGFVAVDPVGHYVAACENGNGRVTAIPTSEISRVLVDAAALADGYTRGSITGNVSAGASQKYALAGMQFVKGLGLHPNVLALSSAVTTTTASQIPVLSRGGSGECSFVLPVITGPGRKGTDDVIASASLDANNQLLAIHENANNNILLRLVTAGSTVGEVDLGIVGDNVYTVISGKIEYADGIGRLAGALEGMSEMVEATGSGIIPPAAFTRWTLGNDHSQAAATQFWGSVLGLRIN